MTQVKEKNEYKYLHTVPFSAWLNWDVKSFFRKTNIFKEGLNLVSGYEILQKAQIEKIKIQNEQKYKIIGVRTKGNGAYLNRTSLGSDLKMKVYQKVKPNHLIWCKVDTKNGGFGIVTDDLKDSNASSNMSLARINTEKIDLDYLQMLFKVKRFQKYLDSLVTGTTNRKYISFNQLQYDVFFPLPTLATQKFLVAKYDKELAEVKKLENKASELNGKIENYLLEELGISIEEKIKNKRFYFANFKELDRWDLWNKKEIMTSKKFHIVGFGTTLLDKPKYGSNSKASDKITDTRYVRITDINEDGSLNDEIVSSEKFDKQYILEENDLLIARSGNTVGKTFLYKNHFGKCIYAGYLVRYRINPQIANPDFIFFYSKIKPFKLWIKSKQRVSGQPNINGQEYLSFPIPLPDIKTQEKIVNKVISLREEIKDVKEKIERIKEEAKKDFETNLFDLL